MPSNIEHMQALAMEATRLIKALAHPERLLICCQLRDVEMSVAQIEAQLGVPQPRLSRELAKLRNDDILAARRESKSVFYRLKDDRVGQIVDTLCRVMLAGHATTSPSLPVTTHNSESSQ